MRRTRMLVLAALAALVAVDVISWPIVLFVAVIDRAGDTLFTPASMAALPLIVPDEHLQPAWAVTEGRRYAVNIVGPPLGGILYSLGRAVPFAADAVSYGISVLTSRGLAGDFASQAEEDPGRGLWAEALDGLKHLWRDSLLRAVPIQVPLINFAVSGAIFTVILGLRKHGVSAVVIGVAEAVIMTVGLVGAVLAPQIRRRVSVRQALLLLTGSGAVAMLSGLVVERASASWAMVLFAAALAAVLPLALLFPATAEEV